MSTRDGRLIFFNGTVMRGQPAHESLQGATFLQSMRTAASYRIYSIRDEHPAMRMVDSGGICVPGEVYFVPDHVWPNIEATEPTGLYRGPVTLSGGEVIFGMLGRDTLIDEQGVDISEYGGWAKYISNFASPSREAASPRREAKVNANEQNDKMRGSGRHGITGMG